MSRREELDEALEKAEAEELHARRVFYLNGMRFRTYQLYTKQVSGIKTAIKKLFSD